MRTFVVEEELVPGELRSDVFDGHGPLVEVPGLDSRRPVGPLHAAVPLGPSRRQDVPTASGRSGMPSSSQASSKSAMNSLPPSTRAAGGALDGQQRERQCGDDIREEASRASARSVLPAVARAKTLVTMNFDTGQTAGEPPVRELLQRAPLAGVDHVVHARQNALSSSLGPPGLGAVLPAPRPFVRRRTCCEVGAGCPFPKSGIVECPKDMKNRHRHTVNWRASPNPQAEVTRKYC